MSNDERSPNSEARKRGRGTTLTIYRSLSGLASRMKTTSHHALNAYLRAGELDHSSFGFLSDFVIRHSSFQGRHSSFA